MKLFNNLDSRLRGKDSHLSHYRLSREGGNPAIARLFWIPALRSAAAGMTSLVAGLINRITVFYTTAPN